jgi:xanthine dehydrogenase accessory factor
MTPFPYVLMRGGGDLGSGVVLRLVHSGLPVVITELAQPLSVRRLVSFSEAVYDGEILIEDIRGRRCGLDEDVLALAATGVVPVVIDPDGDLPARLPPLIRVDARMRKAPPEPQLQQAVLEIGLGPGFTAGFDCDAVVETNRGPNLGRVIWQGGSESDTGIPEQVQQYRSERVLRAPRNGRLEVMHTICEQVRRGTVLARVDGLAVEAPFDGVLRGMLRDGMTVTAGVKIGDLDPRDNPTLCTRVSEKALAIGGGVLEAILSLPEIRARLYSGAGK